MHQWPEAAAPPPMPSAPESAQATIDWARAIGEAHLEHPSEACKAGEQARAIHKKMVDSGQMHFAESVGKLATEAEA